VFETVASLLRIIVTFDSRTVAGEADLANSNPSNCPTPVGVDKFWVCQSKITFLVLFFFIDEKKGV
jgi:hypothetical protein